MRVLLIILGFAATLTLGLAKALAIDQLRGQIQRRITASVEATIARLPAELQEEWADEWRAELAAVISMPITAALYAHGLRHSAGELVVDPARAPTGTVAQRVLIGIATIAATATAAFMLRPVSNSVAIPMKPLSPYCGNAGSERAGATGGQGLKGQHVLVAGVWSGQERAKFARVLRRFEQMTGATVTFTYETHDIAPVLTALVKRHCPPDVALLPQPGLLAQLASQHALQPIDDVASDLVRRNYSDSWRALGEFNHKLYGVWFKAANKSMIWYRPAAFRDARIRPPKTWNELTQSAARLSATGIAPFSIAGATGWTLTDWFENIYLRTAGPDLYDKLTRHAIPWTHPSVKHALELLSQILRLDWRGGQANGVLDTTFEASVRHVFGQRPDAAMVYEGDFVGSELADDAKITRGRDADFFAFPAVERSEPAAVVGGDVAVLFTDNAAAKSLIRFLAKPEAAEPWASAGKFVSPNKNLDPSAYTDPINRRSAMALQKASTIRFDLSDQQHPAFGATAGQGMWEILRDYLTRLGDVGTVTRQLENAATKTHECAQALPEC